MPITATGGLAAKLKRIRETPPSRVPQPAVTAAIPPPKVPVQAASLDSDDQLVEAEWDALDEDELQRLSDMEPSELGLDITDLVVDPDLPEELELDDENGPEPVDPTTEVQVEGDLTDDAEGDEELSQLFQAYFRLNKSPTDEQFHALAVALGLDYTELETRLYRLVGNSVADESIGVHEIDAD